jgi:hypothetical protein
MVSACNGPDSRCYGGMSLDLPDAGAPMQRLILVGLLAACAGKAPPDPNNADGAITPDGAATSSAMSGKAMDYFGGVALEGTALATDGIDPQVTATAATDGAYTMDIAIGSKFFVTATHPNYRPTRNAPVSMADMPLMQDIYVMSTQDVKNQYTVLGKTPVVGTAFFTADLIVNGAPLEGIPLANVTLVDALKQPVPGVVGPYFYGSAGVIDPALTTATAYGTPPRSRVAFLDVPPGTFTLAVVSGTPPVTSETLFSTAADGATLTAMGAIGDPGTPPPPDPKFATDIYPRLQKAASGGLGCANCHTALGPAAVLPFDDTADNVLTLMKGLPGVIDIGTPINSLVLKRPLYEQPPAQQDHPNATFLDITDPDYKLILLWISKGAT